MEKKVSEFAGRREKRDAAPEPGSVPAQDQPSPHVGDFDRNPCGTCWHFKRNPRAGLDAGFCMFGPPVAIPHRAANGQAGNILTRPVLTANMEGCDQWDDESEFVEGEPAEPARLAAGG